MKLKDLQYYQSLVKTRNFSRVASAFNVSQPTITMAIQRLEKDFGTTFFVRDHVHKELHLTPAGKQFAMHVNVILSELEIAHQEIEQSKSTKISFGLPPIIGNYYFPPLTPALMRQGLLSHLETYEHGSKEILKMLEHGDLDIALLGSLTPLKESRLKTIELTKYPFKVIVSTQHPLAKKNKIDFATLKNEKFIVPDSEFFHDQAFKQICRQAHFRPQVIYRTADIHVIKAMVAENLGIAYLTSLAITPEDNITALDISAPLNQSFRLAAAIRSTEVLTPYKQQLWDLLTKKESKQN
ncbi:LysR family transcriptional regulator [Limosilactobacillus sp. STM2_1]|uniref:LysR family transcriptional regulator n=1 Tax=Limosilactobacillus rudii TaxID=2759755 RepID=A0A7W3YPB2_9LACO|nr:LysR family transcriptional regulator [Limosilactobacillus rudii]MBB1078760.1 LysR family transcriptional regulator [Limosilactobacillus rudii]MBB1098192.1 LysR family transcriptional regulator [Limosilactobacillus rudii]MCD7135264.1 LysR family transcriptional regulator [Limosilactobacillus rudii]